VNAIDLLAALKAHFGYDHFRPLQAEIIEDCLHGRDVFALLPTGAGKSLCYQLPALVREGLTIVVSPLIALMKDQVDSLQANGVAATFLNSTLGETEARARLRGLHQGEYKLLYVAPERLMLESFLAKVRSWPVALIAIDEAHCISEWGHDFRPEYRQLARVRTDLPDVPIMALTATATGRVREDIVRQLHLREPREYVASFNRPNLSYRIAPKKDSYDQLITFIEQRKRESGIVYCFSRKSAESVAEKLVKDGIAARPYHAGLTDTERSRNQESFLRDDTRVMCATIAFGMGINKPNVRYVVHYDLPKNLEGYYQETGRAGRDGLPSECLLFFSSGDVAKYQHFIAEMSNPDEQRIARAQLREMVHYAESPCCRRSVLLSYFGEVFAAENCGGCDNCLGPRATYDGTIPAQKLISTILRAKQASRSGEATFGLNHHIDVLLGNDTERMQRWSHQQLSTFGIGKDLSQTEWAAIGRELMRLGFIAQSADQFATVDVTDSGLQALRTRTSITLTRPLEKATPTRRSRRKSAASVPTESASAASPDDALFERLRERRKEIADSRNVPAYIVFSDAALREMAARKPHTPAEFLRVPGVGEKKLTDFGETFLELIREYAGAES
jgi:ATP-dependent DNA helicase RecQ